YLLGDAKLFNPWQGSDPLLSYHREWDEFTNHSVEIIERAIQKIIGNEKWFCLWLPLRRKAHTSNGLAPIASQNYGDSNQPPSFFDRELPILSTQLANTMPMLSSVREVRIWLPNTDLQLQPRLEIELSAGSQRRRLQEREPATGG